MQSHVGTGEVKIYFLDSGILKRWNIFEKQTFNQIWNSYWRLWKFWHWYFVKSSTISSCKQRGAVTSIFVFQAVFTLEEKVSFNPLRLFANPVNLLAYLRGEGELWSINNSINNLKIMISEKSFESKFDQDPLPLYRVLKGWQYTGETSVFEDDHDQSRL